MVTEPGEAEVTEEAVVAEEPVEVANTLLRSLKVTVIEFIQGGLQLRADCNSFAKKMLQCLWHWPVFAFGVAMN